MYTTPVGYEEHNGRLFVTSQTNRGWWKNLRGGAAVSVYLRGMRRSGRAEVIEDDQAVAEYVEAFVGRHGLAAIRKKAIAVEGDTLPPTETLAAGLTETVVVRIDFGDTDE